MKIFDALLTAVMGYAVVFVGLVLLMAVIAIMGAIMVAQKKTTPVRNAAAPAAPAAPAAAKTGPVAPGSAGQIALHDVSDKDAAMVMAIVAHKLGVPVNELRFKSIKEVK